MATKVIVEGTGSWVGLKRGERRATVLDDRLQRKIDRGFVRVVDQFEIAEPAKSYATGGIITGDAPPIAESFPGHIADGGASGGPDSAILAQLNEQPPTPEAEEPAPKPRRGRGKTADSDG